LPKWWWVSRPGIIGSCNPSARTRQDEFGPQTASFTIAEDYVSTVTSRHGPGDRQAKAGAAGLPVSGGLQSLEWSEDILKRVWRDAGTSVVDHNSHVDVGHNNRDNCLPTVSDGSTPSVRLFIKSAATVPEPYRQCRSRRLVGCRMALTNRPMDWRWPKPFTIAQ
jgi:hypothetical protein